jgi:hypothetical protein
MRKLQILGIALVAVLACSAVASASAAEWLVGGKSLTSSVKTVGSGSIVLEDMKVGAAVKCNTTESGTVGAGAADSVTAVSFSGCTTVKGCSSVDAVAAVDLPWATELTSTSKDLIEQKGAGEPGYLVECPVAGILLDDTCKRADSFVEVTNASGKVDAFFNTGEKAKCSLGGEEGLVNSEGVPEVISTESGEALEVS